MLSKLRDVFVEMFENDRRAVVKILGTAGLLALVAAYVMIGDARRGQKVATAQIVGATLAAAAVGAVLGVTLSLKDTVEARLERGDPVGLLLRVLFGSGGWSLAAWFFLLLLGGFFAAVGYAKWFL